MKESWVPVTGVTWMVNFCSGSAFASLDPWSDTESPSHCQQQSIKDRMVREIILETQMYNIKHSVLNLHHRQKN